jgi:hypothetical protein
MYKEGKNLVPLGAIVTSTVACYLLRRKGKENVRKKDLACKNYKGKY